MNGLPKVKINVNKDGLGQVAQTQDGVSAMVLTGDSVTNGIQVGTSVQVFNLDEAIEKGITQTDNPYAYKHVQQFYEEAPSGTELWIMLVDATVTMEEVVSSDQDYAKKLLNDAKGVVRLLAVSRKSDGTATIANGVDADVDAAVVKAQSLVEGYAINYKEVSVIIDGKDFTGDVGALEDYKQSDNEFVSVMLSNTDGSKNAAVGLLLGRLAKDPVMRNPGRVKSGSLPTIDAYFTDGKAIEASEGAWDSIHDKGYIFLRSFVGRSGYFFNDAPTCTTQSNDLNSIPRVRTIYKARRVAYGVFVNEILDEIPLEANGRIAPALIKSWEGLVDNAINLTMTQNGEVSGVRTFIDPAQDVLGTNEVRVSLDILPVGYAKYITVQLGFTTNLS